MDECDEYYVETTSPSRDTSSSLHVQFKTGLTQSNSSLASSTHTAYRYGNQQGYEAGHFGYPTCNGHACDAPTPKQEPPNKPKIISEIFKSAPKATPAGKEENDAIQEEQNRLGNAICARARVESPSGPATGRHPVRQILPGSKFEKLQDDISPSLDAAEADVRSAEYENKGFESTDLTKT